MHSSTKRELLTGAQYLLIGFIAQSSTIRWFGQRPVIQQMLAWLVITLGLGFIRLVVLFLGSWLTSPKGQSISRRNWS